MVTLNEKVDEDSSSKSKDDDATKSRCRICELIGENQMLNHGLSHPCHLANLHQLNHFNLELNYDYNTNVNYMNHVINGNYLSRLKEMIVTACLLRGKPQTIL